MTTNLLAGVRVLDLSDALTYDCGRFLASLGAEVVRVDLPHTPQDTLWTLGNHGKESLVLNYRDQGEGRALLERLIEQSDIVIEAFAASDAVELELDVNALRAKHPRLVHLSITPFGRSGPRANWRGGELTVSAMASTLAAMGEPDRPPVKEPLFANFFHACGAGAAGVLLALRDREKSGLGQHVDIAAQEMGAGRNTVWVLLHQFEKRGRARAGQMLDLGPGPSRAIWALADGHAAFAPGPPGSPVRAALAQWMAARGFDAELGEEAFIATLTAKECVEDAIPRGIPVMPILAPAEVASDRHLVERGYFPPAPNGKPGQWFIHVEAGEGEV